MSGERNWLAHLVGDPRFAFQPSEKFDGGRAA